MKDKEDMQNIQNCRKRVENKVKKGVWKVNIGVSPTDRKKK
jgi:hypothetical protein